ncbi:MAG: hypothetical protein IPI24_07265 [Ignavibacteria bacterium]|nr:hypothetical protein [Ignavibacteria bacterium]
MCSPAHEGEIVDERQVNGLRVVHQKVGAKHHVLKTEVCCDGFTQRQRAKCVEDKATDEPSVCTAEVFLRTEILRRDGIAGCGLLRIMRTSSAL